GSEPRGGRVVAGRRHDLRVPAGCDSSNEAGQAAVLLVSLDAVEHLEHRQVSLASGEAFRAAAPADADGLVPFLEVSEERVHERGLAHAGLTRYDNETDVPASDHLEFLDERVELGVASDDIPHRRQGPRS